MLSQSSLRARLATLACVLTAIAAVTAVPASAQEPPPESPLGFSLEFAPFKKKHRNAAKAIRKDAMRAVVDEVNARWELPIAIPILFADALDAGPAYLSQLDIDLPDGRKITALINFPGPFFDVQLKNVRKQFKGVKGVSTREAFNAAVQFVLAHEIGHALIGQHKLPVLGKEEDAADAFAAYLLADNPKFGPLTAISAAAVFDAMAPMNAKLDESDWADEHSYPRQRVYQFLCWVYGSDAKRFKGIVGKDGLPKERAVRCGDEWEQINRSWDAVLQPHLKATPAG